MKYTNAEHLLKGPCKCLAHTIDTKGHYFILLPFFILHNNIFLKGTYEPNCFPPTGWTAYQYVSRMSHNLLAVKVVHFVKLTKRLLFGSAVNQSLG